MGFRWCGDAVATREVYALVIYQNVKICFSKLWLGIVSSLCGFFSCDFLSLETQLHKRSYSMWHLAPAPKAEACTCVVFPPPQPAALQIHPLCPYCSSPKFILPFSTA